MYSGGSFGFDIMICNPPLFGVDLVYVVEAASLLTCELLSSKKITLKCILSVWRLTATST